MEAKSTKEEILPEDLKSLLTKQHYGLVGNHSAVKVCEYVKKSLYGKTFCYKQQFYGISSHRCLQMTPAVAWCTHRCVFCWRPIEKTLTKEPKEWDKPEDIVEGSLEAHRKLISGFGGILDRISEKKYREALEPNQVAISLAGEPMIYPMMGELINEFSSRDMTTFLVTNGTFPERIAGLDHLPTNFYISLDAPDQKTYKRIDAPVIPDGWDRLNRSLELMSDLDTTRVIRLTMVKGLNNFGVDGYAELIRKAEPDYIEVKSYVCVGYSRYRLSLDNMMSHREIVEFAIDLAEELGYGLENDKTDSRVALLKKK